MRHRSPAICLRTTDYSETSQVVSFLTRGAGAVRLLAKGSKRSRSKSGGMIDLMSEGDLVFSIAAGGEGLGTLMEFSESASHTAIRRDAARLNTALYMLEMADAMLAPSDPHPEVFDLLHNALDRLGAADAPVTAVLAYFQWRLLRRVGLLGDMRKCVSCGATAALPQGQRQEAYFSSRLGGLLCPACETSAIEKYRLDRATLAGLSAVEAAEAGAKVALPDPQAQAVNRMLAYHVREQIGHALRTARFAIG